MATLLMFSGGLDSTATLHRLLTGGRDELRRKILVDNPARLYRF